VSSSLPADEEGGQLQTLFGPAGKAWDKIDCEFSAQTKEAGSIKGAPDGNVPLHKASLLANPRNRRQIGGYRLFAHRAMHPHSLPRWPLCPTTHSFNPHRASRLATWATTNNQAMLIPEDTVNSRHTPANPHAAHVPYFSTIASPQKRLNPELGKRRITMNSARDPLLHKNAELYAQQTSHPVLLNGGFFAQNVDSRLGASQPSFSTHPGHRHKRVIKRSRM